MTQTRLSRVFFRLNEDLSRLNVPWALIGGLAVSARAEPRTTRDIDVAVAVESDRQAQRVVLGLRHLGYGLETHLEQESANRLSTVRLLAPDDTPGILVDLLFASSGIEPEIVAQAETLEVLPGLSVPVATTGHLLALKVLALRKDRLQDRPQDFSDIRELLRVAQGVDIDGAKRALDLIQDRGFHRNKDLRSELAAQQAEFDG